MALEARPGIAPTARSNNEGWFVVEAEQDPAKAPPLKYARTGLAALGEALAAAGYDIREGRL